MEVNLASTINHNSFHLSVQKVENPELSLYSHYQEIAKAALQMCKCSGCETVTRELVAPAYFSARVPCADRR